MTSDKPTNKPQLEKPKNTEAPKEVPPRPAPQKKVEIVEIRESWSPRNINRDDGCSG